jgi:AcrR family transcriptional regulator
MEASNAAAHARKRNVTSTATLDGARARATDRFERLVGAGRSLMRDVGSTEFSVPDVARRARTSLRAFYEFFENKDQLLLAVFANAIDETAVSLREAMNQSTAPVDQLRAYVDTLYHGTFDESHPEIPAMIGLHMQLAAEHPLELATILASRNDLLIDVLRRGVKDGSFRGDLNVSVLAMMVSQTLIATVHTMALGSHLVGRRVTAEELWGFCLAGVCRH